MADTQPAMVDWTPAQHLYRAQVLLDRIDQRFADDGSEHARFVMTPVGVTVAQTHIALAQAKANILGERS
jgi:hypothetical protein